MKRLLALAVLSLGLPLQARAAEPSKTTATYGNWTVTCAQAEAGKACQMAIKLDLTDDAGQRRPLLEMVIGPGEGGNGARLVLRLPLEVALRAPVTLAAGPKGDEAGEELLQGQYLACLPSGCLADAILTGGAVAALSAAAEAKVGFTALGDSRRILVPVDLTGFGDAWAALGLTAL